MTMTDQLKQLQSTFRECVEFDLRTLMVSPQGADFVLSRLDNVLGDKAIERLVADAGSGGTRALVPLHFRLVLAELRHVWCLVALGLEDSDKLKRYTTDNGTPTPTKH